MVTEPKILTIIEGLEKDPTLYFRSASPWKTTVAPLVEERHLKLAMSLMHPNDSNILNDAYSLTTRLGLIVLKQINYDFSSYSIEFTLRIAKVIVSLTERLGLDRGARVIAKSLIDMEELTNELLFPNFAVNPRTPFTLANHIATNLYISYPDLEFHGLDILMHLFQIRRSIYIIDDLEVPETSPSIVQQEDIYCIEHTPYPYLDGNDSRKQNYLKTLGEFAGESNLALFNIQRIEGKKVSEDDLSAILYTRSQYFVHNKGWLVGKYLDVDDFDGDPSTTYYVVSTNRPSDGIGGARILKRKPGIFIKEFTQESISRSLRSLNILPFPASDSAIPKANGRVLGKKVAGQVTELSFDVRQLAVNAKGGDASKAAEHAGIEINYDTTEAYPSLIDQTALAILNTQDYPHDTNPILKKFIAIMKGESTQSLVIPERFMPVQLSGILDSKKRILAEIASLTNLMVQTSVDSFLEGTELWLLETDPQFMNLLEKMYGETSLYQLGDITTVKHTSDGVGYQPDKVMLVLLDIRQALHNIMALTGYPHDSVATKVLGGVRHKDPSLADELEFEFFNNYLLAVSKIERIEI